MFSDLSNRQQGERLLVRRVRRVAADVAAEVLDDCERVSVRLSDDEGCHALELQKVTLIAVKLSAHPTKMDDLPWRWRPGLVCGCWRRTAQTPGSRAFPTAATG